VKRGGSDSSFFSRRPKLVAAILCIGMMAVVGHAEDNATFVSRAKVALLSKLSNPDNVKFRAVIVRHLKCRGGTCVEDPTGLALVCFEANAKNAFGRYTGFEPFVYVNGNLDAGFGRECLCGSKIRPCSASSAPRRSR
jgi:hypothetical protein